VVVEHDEDTIRRAEHLIDLGPAAGRAGGRVVVQGSLRDLMRCRDSVTGQFLRAPLRHPRAGAARGGAPHAKLTITGATLHNLKDLTVQLPLGRLVCVTGVSGSGKSSLVIDTLLPAVRASVGRVQRAVPADAVEGLTRVDKVVYVDQSPIGRTPRSNPATYTGLFTPIRELFAGTPESRSRGYKPGRFSFNVKGGRCEACEGDGVIKVEMHFLPDVYVACDVCKGRRYNRETLEVRYKGKNIHEVLDMTIEDAAIFFQAVPVVATKLQTLLDVGLSYVRLGQNATTLSGGEAQRVKLAKELSKRATGRTHYMQDEPTTGLHY
jgi:excinuclease ABC subunit A